MSAANVSATDCPIDVFLTRSFTVAPEVEGAVWIAKETRPDLIVMNARLDSTVIRALTSVFPATVMSWAALTHAATTRAVANAAQESLVKSATAVYPLITASLDEVASGAPVTSAVPSTTTLLATLSAVNADVKRTWKGTVATDANRVSSIL